VALIGQLSEANAAEFKIAHVGPGSATEAAAIPVPHRIFGDSLRFYYLRSLCHSISLSSKGHAHELQKTSSFLIGAGRGNDRNLQTSNLVDLVIAYLRKDNLLLHS